MLRFVAAGTSLVVCSTCHQPTDGLVDTDGRRGGERLGDALREIKARDARYDLITVLDMQCLFACGEACAVHLRAPEKIAYVLGRFEPTEDAARAILDYARAYGQSEWGEVPYRDWPEGVKGHFITRTPPIGYVVD